MLTGENEAILDLTGAKSDSLARHMGVVHISTSCVKDSLAAAGVLPLFQGSNRAHKRICLSRLFIKRCACSWGDPQHIGVISLQP
jgi:hypothetical protein